MQKISSDIIFGLFGAGGFGREVMPFARETVRRRFAQADVYFVETSPAKDSVNGIPLISEEAFYALGGTKYFNVAVGDSKAREALATRALAHGAEALSLCASEHVIYDNNTLGDGMILCPYSTVTSNATIGKFFHGNLYSYVAHDCIIGDYVTFAPRVSCNGNVRIENHVYVGTNATIRQGGKDAPIVIGEGAVIGMGAVVTKSVPAYTTVIGNPARPMEKRS